MLTNSLFQQPASRMSWKHNINNTSYVILSRFISYIQTFMLSQIPACHWLAGIFFLVSHTEPNVSVISVWLPCLQKASTQNVASAQLNPSDHVRRQCYHGWIEEPTSGNELLVWLNLWTARKEAKVHQKHFNLNKYVLQHSAALSNLFSKCFLSTNKSAPVLL